MLYAYFGGLGADRQSRYELLLEHRDASYTVTALLHTPRVPLLTMPWHKFSLATKTQRVCAIRNPRKALTMLYHLAREANLAQLGQRFCYVLPNVPVYPRQLAAILPPHLRYDGSLPLHPQLWQIGRSLDTLPADRHAQACIVPSAGGDERGWWQNL